jgi:hypothetical protein
MTRTYRSRSRGYAVIWYNPNKIAVIAGPRIAPILPAPTRYMTKCMSAKEVLQYSISNGHIGPHPIPITKRANNIGRFMGMPRRVAKNINPNRITME